MTVIIEHVFGVVERALEEMHEVVRGIDPTALSGPDAAGWYRRSPSSSDWRRPERRWWRLERRRRTSGAAAVTDRRSIGSPARAARPWERPRTRSRRPND